MMGGKSGRFIEKTDRWCAVAVDRDRLCLCESHAVDDLGGCSRGHGIYGDIGRAHTSLPAG